MATIQFAKEDLLMVFSIALAVLITFRLGVKLARLIEKRKGNEHVMISAVDSESKKTRVSIRCSF